jgi:hypothetical protein
MKNFQLHTGISTNRYRKKALDTAVSMKNSVDDQNRSYADKIGKGTSFSSDWSSGMQGLEYLTARASAVNSKNNTRMMLSLPPKLESVKPT